MTKKGADRRVGRRFHQLPEVGRLLHGGGDRRIAVGPQLVRRDATRADVTLGPVMLSLPHGGAADGRRRRRHPCAASVRRRVIRTLPLGRPPIPDVPDRVGLHAAIAHSGRPGVKGRCGSSNRRSAPGSEGPWPTLTRRLRYSETAVQTRGRYYEGLFVICPLELKRELDELDLTEGERNECVWNSPARKAYGRSERAVHGLRTEREELEIGAGRRGAQPEPLYGGGRGHGGAARVHRQGQGALRAYAGGGRAQLL